MGFLTSILTWLAGKILNYLLGRAVDAAVAKAKDIEREQARGEINDANVKAYEEATTEKERLEASLSLLNRSKR